MNEKLLFYFFFKKKDENYIDYLPPETSEKKSREIKITNLKDLTIFVRYIKNFYSEYISNPNSKFKH